MSRSLALVTLLGVGLAGADPTLTPVQQELGAQLAGYHAEGSGDRPPAFAFTTYGNAIGQWGQRYSGGSFGEIYEMVGRPTVALAADGKVAWVAVDSRELAACVDAETFSGNGDAFPCPAKNKVVVRGTDSYAPRGVVHATGLFVKAAKGWSPLAYHIGDPITPKAQAATLAKPVVLDKIPRQLGGADDLVAVFERTIASSKTLAKTVSDRADVVLYGSELAERYVGGKTVKQTLDRWNLSFKVTGLHAGMASKTVGFVAANLEAVAGKGKPTPYRVLAIYEKTDAWKVVQLHFSFPFVP